MPGTVEGEILLLPDTNPPIDDYVYALGVCSGGAAVAAESSADALGALVEKCTAEAGVQATVQQHVHAHAHATKAGAATS